MSTMNALDDHKSTIRIMNLRHLSQVMPYPTLYFDQPDKLNWQLNFLHEAFI